MELLIGSGRGEGALEREMNDSRVKRRVDTDDTRLENKEPDAMWKDVGHQYVPLEVNSRPKGRLQLLSLLSGIKVDAQTCI